MSLRLHGDALARPGLLDFAVNVWPGPRPAALERALQGALAESHRYPDDRAAREAIAARHRRARDEVLLLNGACEAFWLLAQAWRPECAACIHPSFTEAEAALQEAGSEPISVLRERERWTFDPADVPEEADFVVLGNPNNPTGGLDPPERIAALARHGRLLVVDESFIDFVPGEGVSLAGRTDVPGLIVVRSLTKLWSLAGIRAGYLLAPADVVERLTSHRQPWSVNGLACAALAACAGDRETASRVGAEVAAAREEMLAALSNLSRVDVWPAAANFLLVRVPDGPGLVAALRERGLAVRPAGSFPGLDDDHIRIAVRTRAENAVLLGSLEELLA
jgi:histidinol-phosphate/aromatic aminotransferase/cobyric acid decarboxylase-like protein